MDSSSPSLLHGGDDHPDNEAPGHETQGVGCLDPCAWVPELLVVAPEGCTGWSALGVEPADLRLASTLMSGQSFRWERRLVDADGAQGARAQFPADMIPLAEGKAGPKGAAFVEYVGPVENHLFVLRETASDVYFRDATIDSSGSAAAIKKSTDAARDCLRKYLRLPALPSAVPDTNGIDRGALWRLWQSIDPGLARRWATFPGGRLLALPLLEAVICFVGSANNNIKRNSQMVAALCAEFAEENTLGQVDGQEYHAFPSLEQIASVSEERLWEIGWGYRAPRIVKLCVEMAAEGGMAWLESLRDLDRLEARTELCKLTGVGRKVADCIILFSLCCDGCIPVDTHAWQFMQRSGYLPQLKKASGLTDENYAQIGDCLRERFGTHASWAFIVLFIAEVHPFRVSLEQQPTTPTPEMEPFSEKLWFGGSSDVARLATIANKKVKAKASQASTPRKTTPGKKARLATAHKRKQAKSD